MRILLIFFFLTGCASLSDFFSPGAKDKDARVEWRKDMIIDVDGTKYRGMALVPIKKAYTIKIYPPDDRIDRLQWRTCHRENYADKAVKSGAWPWSKKKTYFQMTFKPREIELERACPLRLEGLAAKHKSMSFALVIFPDVRKHYALPSVVECNGNMKIRGGTSECQGAVGTIHKIKFSHPVIQDDRPNQKCPPMIEKASGIFEFFMPENECVYLFMSDKKHQSGKNLIHKLITYGYEKIPPPEGV